MMEFRFARMWISAWSIGLLVVLLLTVEFAQADTPSRGFLKRIYRDDEGEHTFTVFVPQDYSSDTKWPIILFLHGAGERGSDGDAPTKIGLGPFVRKRQETFPFLVVFPQCEDVKSRLLQGWNAGTPDSSRALRILDAVEKEFRVDKNREILTGWSMGGYGVWSIAAATPKRWAAIVPLAGGGRPEWAQTLKDIPVWAFHGMDDAAILPKESRQMIEALKLAGAHPRFNAISGIGHDVWKLAYDSDNLYAWLLDPRSVEHAAPTIHTKPGHRAIVKPNKDDPFLPVLEISKAGYVRLGNDMLDALAYAIPKLVSAELLSGTLDDFSDTTTVDGRNFDIEFSGISYTGKLTQARINAHRKDHLNIQLGLQDITITIDATYVTGKDHSATAGPIYIVIGYQRPAWLSFDVMPFVNDRQIRLKLVTTQFDIPEDNWYVTSPADISTRGLGMTRKKVSNGLVNGLYGSQDRIEQEITSVIPSLLNRIEKKLIWTDVTDLVSSFWPLPVYRPRIRVWPDQIATDKNGVSVVFGVTAAAVNAKHAPAKPKLINLIGRTVGAVPKSTSLRIGVAPNLLRPLTNLLIQADVARIHVLDIPETKFRPLADRNVLDAAIPDLKRYTDNVEIWSELVLAEPIMVVDAKPQPNANGRFQFNFPKILISLAIKNEGNVSQWTPFAEFEVQLTQLVQVNVSASHLIERALKLSWVGEPDIRLSGRFASGYQPKSSEIKAEMIKKIFVDGWRGWTSQGPFSKTRIPDINFGLTKLRLSKANWSAPDIVVEFSAPGVKITNRSNISLVYETKGPHSGWGGPYTLEAGNSHDYTIPYPLTYRHRTDAGVKLYTLPVGSHCEFRVPKNGGSPDLFQVREKKSDLEHTPNKMRSTDS